MIYIEKALRGHPQVETIQQRLRRHQPIWIHHYGEIFNRHGQNFRLQKNRPTFILAQKKGTLVYEAPAGYGIGKARNYYFSHLLNCPFDCRYCFLQGMYRSAHYVLFVNYEAFQSAIQAKVGTESATFFSGYDGDSLALECYSGFLASFLPFFRNQPQAELEIRTKSAAIQPLLNAPLSPNVVIAYSLNPAAIAQTFEPKTPPLRARLKALQMLQNRGWRIGLRFDPILYVENFTALYSAFFRKIFTTITTDTLHSVTLGAFRLPKPLYKKMTASKPREPLLAQCSERENNKMGLTKSCEQRLLTFCFEQLCQWVPKEKIFLCQ
ncbi:MAG: spore photoproduct lyase family protein [Chlamydiota bacterium]